MGRPDEWTHLRVSRRISRLRTDLGLDPLSTISARRVFCLKGIWLVMRRSASARVRPFRFFNLAICVSRSVVTTMILSTRLSAPDSNSSGTSYTMTARGERLTIRRQSRRCSRATRGWMMRSSLRSFRWLWKTIDPSTWRLIDRFGFNTPLPNTCTISRQAGFPGRTTSRAS